MGEPGTPLGSGGTESTKRVRIVWLFARVSAGSRNYSIGARERYLAMPDHILAVAPDQYAFFCELIWVSARPIGSVYYVVARTKTKHLKAWTCWRPQLGASRDENGVL